MSLHIILGFDSPGSASIPSLVYAGRSGSEAQAAMAASTSARFEIIRNPITLRKNNPNATANRAALDPEAVKAKALAAECQKLEAEGRAEWLREMSRLEAEAQAKAQGISIAAVNVVRNAIAKVAQIVAENAAAGETAQQRADREAGPESPPLPVSPSPKSSESSPSSQSSAPSESSEDETAQIFAPTPRRKKQT